MLATPKSITSEESDLNPRRLLLEHLSLANVRLAASVADRTGSFANRQSTSTSRDIPRQSALTSRYALIVYPSALGLTALVVTFLLNQPAPEIVYKAF